MYCPKCKNKNQEESVFCNKCGTKLQVEDEQVSEELRMDSRATSIKDKILDKKVVIPIAIACCLILVYLFIKPPSVNSVYNKAKYMSDEPEEVFAYLEKVYPDEGGFLGLFKEKNHESKIKVLELIVSYRKDEFEREFGVSLDDLVAVKISDVEIERPSYSSDYVDIKVTVTNNGERTVNYIKINLFYKDSAGKIIRSEWTNDSSAIKPGASQVITKMTKDDGWYSVEAEIADISY